MIKYFLTLLLLALPCFAAPSVTLAWDPNSEADLAGYILYRGVSSRVYTNQVDVGNVTNTVVTNLIRGVTYYFAVTAYNTSGLESDFSNEVSFTTSKEEIVSITLDIANSVSGQWTNVYSILVTNPINQQFWKLTAERLP